jgi:hypothetical protein
MGDLVRCDIAPWGVLWVGSKFKGALQAISMHEGRIGIGGRVAAGSLAAAVSCVHKWHTVSIRADRHDCGIPPSAEA